MFLCHASADKDQVRRLYVRLRREGLKPWLDEEDLKPGHNWKTEVHKAIRRSLAVVVCLSAGSVEKTGFVQEEISLALDAAEERPEGTIFVIPARLEDCDVPERMRHLQRVDLFKPDGYALLLDVLAELRLD